MSDTTRPRKGGVLPNTLICGVTKGGTTTLWSYFRDHPQALVARHKEVHFFDYEARYARGLAWYAREFSGYAGQQAIVDATPAYYLIPEVPRRIRAALPDARLILIFRNPIERTYSNFWMGYARGRPGDSFDACVRLPQNRHLLAGSFYAKALQRFLEVFPREQLLLLLTDALRSDPDAVRQRCYAHAGIDAAFVPGAASAGRGASEAQNIARAPRSLRLQRLLYRTLADKPEEELQYDAQGNVLQREDTRASLTGRIALQMYHWASALNTRPAKYAPIRRESAELLLELFRSDIERFSQLSGLDTSPWLTLK